MHNWYQSLFCCEDSQVFWISTRMGTQRHTLGKIPSVPDFLQVITSPSSSPREKKKRKRNGEINPCDPRQEHGTQNVVFHKHCGDADQGPTFPLKDWYRFTGNKKPLGGSVSVEQCTITCSSTRTNFEDIFNQTV